MSHSYIGYYRDYQIYDKGEYYNLNEGIIEQFDNGIATHKLYDKNNQSALYLFKPNLDYKIDSYLASSYNSKDKYIKDFEIFNFGGNELGILNAHNPIRIFNNKSFSYVNELEKDFFLNHTFEKGRKFTTNDDELITIHFKGRKGKVYSKHKVKGEMIISIFDYTIHSFKYIIYNDKETTPILNIDISYKKRDSIMYLNYMSFNNKFYVQEKEIFKQKEVVFNLTKKRFEIKFNRKIDVETLKIENFKLNYKNKKIPISKLVVVDERNIFLNVAKINSNIKNNNNDDDQSENLTIFIKNVKDIDGQKIYEQVKKPAYQFREFFVQEVFEEKELSSEIQVIYKMRPLSESRINKLDSINNYIINSPLMNRKLF
jgi:hypothetical protein